MDSFQNVHVKLLARDFLTLTIRATQPPSFCNGSGMPVFRVEIVGVVVSCERRDKSLKFSLDDGTGVFSCILWLNHHERPRTRYWSSVLPSDLDMIAGMAVSHAENIQLGLLVRAKGRVTVYRGELQVTVTDVLVERDPNMEVLHWLDYIRLARRCYDCHPAR